MLFLLAYSWPLWIYKYIWIYTYNLCIHIWIGIIHKAKWDFNNNLEDLWNGIRLLPKYSLIGNSGICDIKPGSHRVSKWLLGDRACHRYRRQRENNHFSGMKWKAWDFNMLYKMMKNLKCKLYHKWFI